MTNDMWTYRDNTWSDRDFTGYKVEATDGSIGKVDEATHDVGAAYIVVDTGPWILGSKVLLPAGVVDRVDHQDEKVYVTRSKDEIKDSPKLDEATYRDESYRTSVADYYGARGQRDRF